MHPPYRRRLGAYRLISRLALGGSAELFLAKGEGGAACVIKRLLPHAEEDPLLRGAFEHEAWAYQQAAHPLLVPLIEASVGVGVEVPFLVFPFLEGRDLRDAPRGGFWTEERLFALCVQVGTFLEHIHALEDDDGPLELCHGDLSLTNILWAPDGRFHVLDLGASTSRCWPVSPYRSQHHGSAHGATADWLALFQLLDTLSAGELARQSPALGALWQSLQCQESQGESGLAGWRLQFARMVFGAVGGGGGDRLIRAKGVLAAAFNELRPPNPG